MFGGLGIRNSFSSLTVKVLEAEALIKFDCVNNSFAFDLFVYSGAKLSIQAL